MIAISNIKKSYGSTRVLDDVTLTIPTGGLTSIVGPNGAGKSTLLAVVSRLMKADSGAVRVGGLDIAETADDVLARKLSIMRQENHIAARLTVRDLVGFGRFPYSRGRLTAEDASRIDDALVFADLQGLSDRFLDQLSGGQRQRAFFAMVLAQDTDYVLFDEPLNNLDVKHAVATMRLIRRMAHEFGKTVVLVVHDLNFASAYSDRIIAMREGRIAAEGSPAEIIEETMLQKVFDTPFVVRDFNGKRIVDFYS
ncbi:ATP-binding cassette domain-containing protein [Martelella lutilitoris]|uniref:ATP-binding cassette domain-containing protein n=1 Tax=Martelella lutilitoris TaxID=2583532 RepID=A0A7T7KMP0_9HYPH|nr:ATP-binding cassette domain-containing protein [Martelella lutilitoris]QQM32031.1 ATP-binding cassette domain-containing protein [Martelella lutilitoris]